jgi:hypothetical protein
MEQLIKQQKKQKLKNKEGLIIPLSPEGGVFSDFFSSFLP